MSKFGLGGELRKCTSLPSLHSTEYRGSGYEILHRLSDKVDALLNGFTELFFFKFFYSVTRGSSLGYRGERICRDEGNVKQNITKYIFKNS